MHLFNDNGRASISLLAFVINSGNLYEKLEKPAIANVLFSNDFIFIFID